MPMFGTPTTSVTLIQYMIEASWGFLFVLVVKKILLLLGVLIKLHVLQLMSHTVGSV